MTNYFPLETLKEFTVKFNKEHRIDDRVFYDIDIMMSNGRVPEKINKFHTANLYVNSSDIFIKLNKNKMSVPISDHLATAFDAIISEAKKALIAKGVNKDQIMVKTPIEINPDDNSKVLKLTISEASLISYDPDIKTVIDSQLNTDSISKSIAVRKYLITKSFAKIIFKGITCCTQPNSSTLLRIDFDFIKMVNSPDRVAKYITQPPKHFTLSDIRRTPANNFGQNPYSKFNSFNLSVMNGKTINI